MKNLASTGKEEREEKTRVRANNGIVYARTSVRREFCERMNETGGHRRERVLAFRVVSGSRYATNVGENVDYLRPDAVL